MFKGSLVLEGTPVYDVVCSVEVDWRFENLPAYNSSYVSSTHQLHRLNKVVKTVL